MITDLQLLSLFLLCLVVFAVRFRQRGEVRMTDPASLFLVVFLLGTGVKLIYWIFFRAKNFPESLNVFYDPVMMGKDERFLIPGMLFITLSVAAYCFGLCHRRAIALKIPDFQIDEALLVKISVLVCTVTSVGLAIFLLRLDAFSTGELFQKRFNDTPGGSTGRFFIPDYWLFKGLSSIKYIFYVLLLYFFLSDRRRVKIHTLLVATLLLSLLVPSVVGSRAHVFVIFLDLFVLGALTFHRRRVKVVSILIGIAIIFLAATAIARHARPADPVILQANTRKAIEEKKEAIATIEQRYNHQPVDEERLARSLWFTRLVGDEIAKKIDVQMRGRYFLDLYKTAHIVDDVPERMSFLYGESFLGWPFVLVPKSVWPGKPMFARVSPVLADKVFLEPSNNVPPGLVGEAWLNFGWLGFLAVGAVGFSMGLAYNSYQHAKQNPIAQIIYVMLLTRVSFTMFNTSFGDAVLQVMLDIVPVLLVFWLTAQPTALRRAS